MELRTLFSKSVDRAIEGVIKADDEASLRLEVEEYVITNEVAKRLETFIDAYNNYQGANGVWISGFFGSGKSHLLKMLALLLENRLIDGVSTLDMFIPKCGDNEILRGDIKRAASIPSRSILFNIDQKADVISKTQVDALLAVFVKVFNEMCGYYGKQGHIAQFERELDMRGLYTKFQDAYSQIAKKPWDTGREEALLEADSIAKAYGTVTDTAVANAHGILDKYRAQHKVSIEDFADMVNAWLKLQKPDFRLNFFVDEVGQYIADNIKLMTNLQTIAESLATKCRGRAWVIVTSQNDMSTLLGEFSKQQSNDFSKIMARFNNKMILTSTDVAEVIQRRLLEKTDEGVEVVSDLYHLQVNNFGTLFGFTDGSRTYKNYSDRDDFIRCYPFVPYQFDLFQSAIENLSIHNAFEGKHSSVGERSMLGVFQQVAKQVSPYEIGRLATFDLMFEGIRSALMARTQKTLQAAERQLRDDFATRVLKVLFLVKYMKEFKPTLSNLCVLMIESFSQDLGKLRKQLEAALNVLEKETYIQRNGPLYEFLTDEEQDIEKEIKQTDVDHAEVSAELEKLVFDYILKQRKIRYDAGTPGQGQDYAYTRKLDDKPYGREQELAIHLISPFHELVANEQMLRNSSTYKAEELFICLPPDARLMSDLYTYKRTEKYIRQNYSVAQQEATKRILSHKGDQNQERLVALQQRMQQLLAKARLLVAGGDIEVSSEDAQTRVIRGFHALIERTYPHLRMLRGINYTENDIGKYLKHSQESLLGTDVTSLSEAEQDLLNFIQSNSRGGIRTTLKAALEKFERKPYGWYQAAILCNVALLCARGKVEVRVDSNLIEDEALQRALHNSHGYGNVILEPQVEFTASQVRRLKELFADFFDKPAHSTEAKALGSETNAALQALIQDLQQLAVQRAQYPFLQNLDSVLEKLKPLSGKPYSWYVTELVKQEDELLALKESTIDPLRKFMAGPLRAIYDEGRRFIQSNQPNFSHIDGNEATELQQAINDPLCFKGARMQQVRSLLDSLGTRIMQQRNKELEQARNTLAKLEKGLTETGDFAKLTLEQQAGLQKFFPPILADMEAQPLIAVIRDRIRSFQEVQYRNLLAGLPKLHVKEDNPTTPQPQPVLVSLRELQLAYNKPWLTNEQELDEYLKACREAILAELRQGKRIQL